MTRPDRPAIEPSPPWRFPAPSTGQLPNGLRTQVYRMPGQHVVSIIVVLDVPLTLELPEVEGLATIALRGSDEGTQDHPGESLLDALEATGAAYEGSATASATICSLDVPSTRLRPALELLGEIVRQPRYDDADVERHVALRLGELDQLLVSAPSLAALAVRAVLFDPSSRESRPQGGMRRSVEMVTPELVRAFHDQYWRPEGATLIVAGDVDDDLERQLAEVFGDWEAVSGPVLHITPQPSSQPTLAQGRPVVHLVDLPAAVQTEIRISGHGVDRASQDFAALQVAAVAMGGSFGSRLNSVLREQLGYTYGVHFSVAPARIGGTWAVSMAVRTEVSAAALAESLRIMDFDDPFTEQEVADAASNLVGIAPLRYDTAGAIAGQAATLAAAGWDPDFVNRHFAALAATTPRRACEAYQRVVLDGGRHLVLVGDAATVGPQLEQAGFCVVPMEGDGL